MEQADQPVKSNETIPAQAKQASLRAALVHSGLSTRIGALLIVVGLIILADINLKTGWLALIVFPILGFASLAGSIFYRRAAWLIPGALAAGLGTGVYLAFTKVLPLSLYARLGSFLLAFGLSWLAITLFSTFLNGKTFWWALVPGGILASTGLVFLLTPLRLLDFVLYITLGLGLAFLAWGLACRLFGLIIPGSLLVSIGPGIYFAWAEPPAQNALIQTGVMLVSFALGWGLITVLSRRVTHKFVWWPLIPGGIMAMVGWGLYIGGDPGSAVSFIGNTGSIGLILFGIYLLLLRRGIHH